MADGTGIEWTDATWNIVIGCDKVSPGCDNCYAIRTAHRMSANPNEKIATVYAGTEADGEWTGRINLIENRLELPFQWTKPRRIFVNAQSDLFHKDVPDEFIARVWAVMAQTPRHTYQILTKRPARMRSLMNSAAFVAAVDLELGGDGAHPIEEWQWPLRNVWLGVSVEDQKRADLRIPALLETPAAVRFLSMEPLLGPVDLTHMDVERHAEGMYWINALTGRNTDMGRPCPDVASVDWVIVGGESGPGARPMHPQWARSLRDQCTAAGVPFLFKQWGEWQDGSADPGQRGEDHIIAQDGRHEPAVDHWAKDPRGWWASDLIKARSRRESGTEDATFISRVGKKAAGRELDGRTWDEFPA